MPRYILDQGSKIHSLGTSWYWAKGGQSEKNVLQFYWFKYWTLLYRLSKRSSINNNSFSLSIHANAESSVCCNHGISFNSGAVDAEKISFSSESL